MTERQFQILEIIFNSVEGVTGREWSARLGVSSRTIRNEINRINSHREEGLVSASKQTGYYIAKENLPHVRGLLAGEREPSPENELRGYKILGKLMAEDRLDTYDLAEELHLAQPTVLKEIAKLKTEVYKKEKGICAAGDYVWLEADEWAIRRRVFRIMEEELQRNRRRFPAVMAALAGDEYDQREYDILMYAIRSYFEKASVKVSDTNLMLVAAAVDFCMVRNGMGRTLDAGAAWEEPVGTGVKKLLEHLREQELGLSEGDFRLLSTLFHTLKLSAHLELSEEVRQLSRAILEEFLREVLEKYDFDLHSSDSLYENMLIHIEYMMRRAETGYEIQNPLMEDIKKTYPFAYEIAMLMVPIVYHCKHIYIRDDEVAYIAVFVQHYLENINVRLKTVVIGSSRNSINAIVTVWLKNHFFNHVEVTDVILSYSLEDYLAEHEVDLIVSTGNLSVKGEIPYYWIESVPDEKATEDLSSLIRKIRVGNRCVSIIQKYFFPEEIVIFREEETFESVVRELAARLEKGNKIESGNEFVEDVLQREENYPTVLGEQMMIPHPLMTFAQKTAVAVAILKRPVHREGKEITLIMMPAIEAKLNQEVDALFQLFNRIAADGQKLRRLWGTENAGEFLETLIAVC